MGVDKKITNTDSSAKNSGPKNKKNSGKELQEIIEQFWEKSSSVFSSDNSSILKKGDFEKQLKETKERSEFVLSKAEKALNDATAIQLKNDESIASVKQMLEDIKILKKGIEGLKGDMWNIIIGILIVIVIFVAGLVWDFFKVRGDDYRAHNEKYMHSLNKITEFEGKITEIQNNQNNIEQGINDKISAEINKRIVEFLLKDKQVKVTE